LLIKLIWRFFYSISTTSTVKSFLSI